MRKIPSFVLCAITMILFIGPALLSVGIPVAPRAGEAAKRAERDMPSAEILYRDADLGFELLRPRVSTWHVDARATAPRAHEVRLVRAGQATEPAIQVTLDARRSNERGSPAGDIVERIEDVLAGELTTRPKFRVDVDRFATDHVIQIEATGLSTIPGAGDVFLTARAVRHERCEIVITVRANDATLASAHAALDEIERCIRTH